MFDL
jgi:malonate-semialdehyde dehydrogenase (acetylating)/methylmalonate-semialdehyde dehydrogenase